MADLRVDRFRAQLTGGGARANMFEVNIAFPGYAGGDTEITNFMCRSAQIPASIIGTVEVPFRGRIIKLAGDRTFEPWTITVYNDTTFNVRNAFERWMNGLNSHVTNLSAEANNSGIGGYAANMEVNQLDQQGTVTKQYILKNAFPINVAPIDLTYDAATAIEEFTVTIEYDYWFNDNVN
ncbi:MAG: phage tail protein [Candidatus Poseidoniales archaeon]